MIVIYVLMGNAQAEIFKCKQINGRYTFQDKPCANIKRQSKVTVQFVDPDKVIEAQKKLSEELQQRRKLKATQVERVQKEREIIAIEDQARSNNQLVETARENVEAIERNTAAIKSKSNNRTLFYTPHLPNKTNVKHHTKESGLNLNISIK